MKDLFPADPTPSDVIVVEISPLDVIPAPGNREITLDMVKDLLPSIGNPSIGQQVPGIVYCHPDQIGKYVCVEGNRRRVTTQILGMKFKTIVLDKVPSDADVRRIRLTTNLFKKNMTADQIADDIQAHIDETGITQDAAADFFGLSPGYVSKLLDRKNLLPELGKLRGNPAICEGVITIIAGMPTPEMQMELATKVEQLVKTCAKAKRDVVERIAKQIKGSKGRGKEKSMKITCGGVVAVIKGNVMEAFKAFLAKGSDAIKRIEKDNLPAEFLAALMKGGA